jgi:hypothetical protein
MNEAKRSSLCGGQKKEEEEKRDMGLLTMRTIKEKENGKSRTGIVIIP